MPESGAILIHRATSAAVLAIAILSTIWMLNGCEQSSPPSTPPENIEVSTSTTCGAQAVLHPEITTGMNYGVAREAIVRAGFERPDTNCNTQSVGADTCNAFPEVEDCAGTGEGNCRMNFLDEAGHRLTVFTIGGAPNPESVRLGDITVNGFEVSCH